MNTIKLKTDHSVISMQRIPYPILLTLSLIFVTACALPEHRRDAILEVLNHENSVIKKIESERKKESIVSKVKADPDLYRAESKLMDAIRAIKDANAAVKEAL